MFRISVVVWVGCVLVSWLFLLFYRSPYTGHGPDTVGDEVSHFLLPLVCSLPFSIALIWITPEQSPSPVDFFRWSPLVTIMLGVAEVLVYLRFIMR